MEFFSRPTAAAYLGTGGANGEQVQPERGGRDTDIGRKENDRTASEIRRPMAHAALSGGTGPDSDRNDRKTDGSPPGGRLGAGEPQGGLAGARSSQGDHIFDNQTVDKRGAGSTVKQPNRATCGGRRTANSGRAPVRQAPWERGDLSVALVYRNKMWFMGGHKLPGKDNSNAVWSSARWGRRWTLGTGVQKAACAWHLASRCSRVRMWRRSARTGDGSASTQYLEVPLAGVGYIGGYKEPGDTDPENTPARISTSSSSYGWDYRNRSLVVDLGLRKTVNRILLLDTVTDNHGTASNLKKSSVRIYFSDDNSHYVRYSQDYDLSVKGGDGLTCDGKPVFDVLEFDKLAIRARYIKLNTTYGGDSSNFVFGNIQTGIQVFQLASEHFEIRDIRPENRILTWGRTKSMPTWPFPKDAEPASFLPCQTAPMSATSIRSRWFFRQTAG